MSKQIKPQRGGGYFQLHYEWFDSPAYEDLKCNARCLLNEFIRISYPHRNGQLSVSVINAGRRLKIHPDTAGKAFYDLVEHGFLILTKGELWQQRKAREWAVTILPMNGAEPTDDWRKWMLGNPVRSIPTRKTRSQSKGQGGLKQGVGVTQTKGQRVISEEFAKLVVIGNQ